MPKKSTLKQKSLRRRLAKTQRQRARNNLTRSRLRKELERQRNMMRARQNKEGQRVFEENNTGRNNNINNVKSLSSSELNRLEMEELEYMEREHERMEVEKAVQAMNAAQKERFYIRVNYKDMYKASELLEKLHDSTFYFDTLEVLRLSYIPEFTYYYIINYDEEDENNYNHDDYGRVYYRQNRRMIFDVREVEPFEYFRESFEPHSWEFYGPPNNGYQISKGKHHQYIYNFIELVEFLTHLPGFMKKVQAERIAKITVPRKLTALQQKGLEGTIREFEKKSGKEVPRNMQNLIETYMERKPPQMYYEKRDNLGKINTSLFQ